MLTKDLTVWVTPFTSLPGLFNTILQAQSLAASIRARPNLLIPTNFGPWPQSECTQSLPADMLVATPEDVTRIRSIVEMNRVGFGVWFVPVNNDDSRAPGVGIPELCASFAAAAGYAAANFEPGVFWRPGDDPAAVDTFWSRFWNALPDQNAMSGNVIATAVPNPWGIGAFRRSLPNLAAGCNALALEVYGGLQTAGEYPAPNLWPTDGFAEIRATGVDANLIPILATANLTSQASQANRLGHGNIHVWAI